LYPLEVFLNSQYPITTEITKNINQKIGRKLCTIFNNPSLWLKNQSASSKYPSIIEKEMAQINIDVNKNI